MNVSTSTGMEEKVFGRLENIEVPASKKLTRPGMLPLF